MDISTKNQAYVFLMMCVVGLLIGVLYDAFRVLRKHIKPGYNITGVTDMVFWVLVSIGVFGAIFYLNSGQIRWFEFAGVIIGSVIYFLSISLYIRIILEYTAKTIYKIFAILLKIILTPIVFLYKMLLMICSPIFKVLWALGHRFKKTAVKMQMRLKKMWSGFLLAKKKT